MTKIICFVFCILTLLNTLGCSPAAETTNKTEVKYFAIYVDNTSVKVNGVQKSVDEFMAEIQLQQRSGVNIQLNVAGKSSQEKEVTELARRLKKELNITRVSLILESM